MDVKEIKKIIVQLRNGGLIPAIANDTLAEHFIRVSNEKGLSPLSREIYLTAYKLKSGGVQSAIVVGINGFRKIARDAGGYVGSDAPIYNIRGDGSYETATDLKIKGTLPISCRVTIRRITEGVVGEYTAEVLFEEFVQTKIDWKTKKKEYSGNWKVMPFQMIAKVAEAFAIRKAYADSCTDLFVEGEQDAIERIHNTTIAGKVVSANKGEDLSGMKSPLQVEIEDALKALAKKEEIRPLYDKYKRNLTDKPELINLFTSRAKELDK